MKKNEVHEEDSLDSCPSTPSWFHIQDHFCALGMGLNAERALQEFGAFCPGMLARPCAGRFGLICFVAKISQRLNPCDAGGAWNLRAPRTDIETLQGRQCRADDRKAAARVIEEF